MDFPPTHPLTTFTVTPEDYCNAQRLCMRRLWLNTIRPWISFAVMIAAAVMLMVSMRFDAAPSSGLIAGVLTILAFPLIQYCYLLPRRSRRIHAQQKTLRVLVEASWTDEGFFLVDGDRLHRDGLARLS